MAYVTIHATSLSDAYATQTTRNERSLNTKIMILNKLYLLTSKKNYKKKKHKHNINTTKKR